MADHAAADLEQLIRQLKEWLAFQDRLGWQGAAVSPPSPPLPSEAAKPAKKRPTLAEIREEMGDCRRCRLWRSRTHLVFGEGSPTATLMFVGEGPGAGP